MMISIFIFQKSVRIYNNLMSKILISLLIVGLFSIASAGDCFGEDCAVRAKGDP